MLDDLDGLRNLTNQYRGMHFTCQMAPNNRKETKYSHHNWGKKLQGNFPADGESAQSPPTTFADSDKDLPTSATLAVWLRRVWRSRCCATRQSTKHAEARWHLYVALAIPGQVSEHS